MKLKIEEKDFEYQWYSGTGKGGQHRNKHQNCCRCIHVPTGISANGASSRSREDNKKNARAVCVARIERHFHKDTERFRATEERVRTYHAVDNVVYDHASGERDTYQNVIDKGNVSDLIEARAKAVRNRDETR